MSSTQCALSLNVVMNYAQTCMNYTQIKSDIELWGYHHPRRTTSLKPPAIASNTYRQYGSSGSHSTKECPRGRGMSPTTRSKPGGHGRLT
eukprot:6610765-Pyramimonas_sp.AAC.2